MNKGIPLFIISLQDWHLLYKGIVNTGKGRAQKLSTLLIAHLPLAHGFKNCPEWNQKPVIQCFISRHEI